MMSGSLSAHLRQQSGRISSIIRRRHFNCGAYSTSAGGLVSRNSGIVSNKRIPGSIGSKGSGQFGNTVSSSETSKHSFKKMSHDWGVKARCNDELVEVFSVLVNGVDHEVSTVCGLVKMHHWGKYHVYDRDYDNPEVLSQDKSILSLECHAPIYNLRFGVELYVIDPIHNLEFCEGILYWRRWTLFPRNTNLTYLGERLCSVVRGKHGYAVVHYSIFSSADSTLVEVFFSPNDAAAAMNDPIDVSGSIYARYSNQDYSTDYQKKYFRSRLFDRPCQMPIRVAADSSLPLLKSVIAVPRHSSLIIDVDLCVRGVSSLRSEAFVSSEEFEVDIEAPREYMEISGVNCRVGLSVISY